MNLFATFGVVFGSLIGAFIALMIYRTRKYGSFDRAWCRTVHKLAGLWNVRHHNGYGTQYRCSRCDRPWQGRR